MVITKAGEALRLAVDPTNGERKKKYSQSDLARDLGVSQPSVSEWVRMNTRPESHLRKAIQVLLGIPEGDWMTESELAVIGAASVTATERAKVSAEAAESAESLPVASDPAA